MEVCACLQLPTVPGAPQTTLRTRFPSPKVVLGPSEVFQRGSEAFLVFWMVTLTKPVKRMATRRTHVPFPPVPSHVQVQTSEMGMVNSECPKHPFSATHASGRLFAVKNDPSRTIQGRTWPRHRLSQTLHRSWPVKKKAFWGVKFGQK